MLIERNTPSPLYLQLKTLLKVKIESAELPPGTRLPSERELCDQYGVSRTTVRQTLREMEQEKLLETIPGLGTFVAHLRTGLRLNISIAGFTADINREGMSPSSQLLDASLVETPNAIQLETMQIPEREELVRIERLRLANNSPLAIHTSYLVHHFCPGILQYNLASESIMKLLRENYGLNLSHAVEEAYATLADQREMKLLHLPYPSAVLRTERITYLDNGQIIEISKGTNRGDWLHLKINLNTDETLKEPMQSLLTAERKFAE